MIALDPMTVNIWKSYMSTAVEEMNIEAILAIMNTAELVIEIKPDFLSVKPGLTKYVF